MEYDVPRVVIAGTNSGCGKTTAACAILQALVDRGLNTGAFKCGPDYIDTMFHSKITGTKSFNLDTFFFSDDTLRYLLAKNGAVRDINIIEGVMGFYDGLGSASVKASTYDVARVSKSPVILVVGAKGASLSTLAVIQGFLDFYPDNNICGVILNQCTEMTYRVLAKEIEKRFEGRVRPLGFLPNAPECAFESRHLGLVTAAEVAGLHEKMKTLAQLAERSLDIDGIIETAKNAVSVSFTAPQFERGMESVRIAVARDKAFCFYYEDNIDILQEMGAETVEFSPLADDRLPENIHGIYIGGGYPELYAKRLSENVSMRQSVKAALERGVPCIAECGGFMYLTEFIDGEPMVGHLPGRCFDNGRLTRFGYVTLKAEQGNMLCSGGMEIRGHEFHHWDCEFTGDDFTASKTSGKNWKCVYATDRLYAGYPHFHFYAAPEFAAGFYKACLEEKYNNDRKYKACRY